MVEGAERIEMGQGDLFVALGERSCGSQPVKSALVLGAGARKRGLGQLSGSSRVALVELLADLHDRRLVRQLYDDRVEDLGRRLWRRRRGGGDGLRLNGRRPDFAAHVLLLMARQQQTHANRKGPNSVHLANPSESAPGGQVPPRKVEASRRPRGSCPTIV